MALLAARTWSLSSGYCQSKKKSVSFLRILLIHFHGVHVTWTKNKNYFVGTPDVIIHVFNFFYMYCPSWHQGHLCTKFLSSCILASLFYHIRMPSFLLRVIPFGALVHKIEVLPPHISYACPWIIEESAVKFFIFPWKTCVRRMSSLVGK